MCILEKNYYNCNDTYAFCHGDLHIYDMWTTYSAQPSFTTEIDILLSVNTKFMDWISNKILKVIKTENKKTKAKTYLFAEIISG